VEDAKRIAANAPTSLGERRQVSVLFADMVGYTAIAERLGEERTLGLVRIIYEKLTGAVREHGGSVRGFAGDSIMAVFGVPEAQEDTALRACRTALAIHAAFAAAADEMESQFGERPSMRAGVSSGIAVMAPVEGEGAPLTAVGDTVNLAARLQGLARAGGTMICDTTRRLVEWLADTSFDGEQPIKGKSKPQKVWRLNSVRKGGTRFDASLRRGLGPHVGRDDELAKLHDALGRARERLQVIDLVAEPGLGKTRLVSEFLQRLQADEAFVLIGHCAADGQQIPFLPFLEVVRGAFRIRPEDDPAEITRKLDAGLRGLELHTTENLGLLLNLLGLEPPEASLAGLDGVLIGLRTRDLLPALLKARRGASTVVVLLEDIHWVDRASEEMVGKLIEAGEQPNLLVIHTARPEYLPRWRGGFGVTTLALKPLAAGDIQHVLQTRLGVASLPDALMRRVTERAGGNPLFGEEILSFLIEQGALRVASGKADFDATIGEDGLPASIQGLLAARMDRLPREDRALLQAAATIGRRFDPNLLSLVVETGDDVGAALQRLQAQDIVYKQADSSDYVFKHILLRDSVYQSLVTGRRTELHRKIAEALEQRSEGRLAEAAETLAHHYVLADRKNLAFTYLAMAGAKSLGVYSLDEADRYLSSALALFERDPSCASDEQLVELLANYALCSNISLRLKTIIEVTTRFRPNLNRAGDSRHHALILHHYISSLVWTARFRDALNVQQELSAMARRLRDPKSMAYALVSELSVSTYCAPVSIEVFQARRRDAEAALANVDDAYLRNFYSAILAWDEVNRGRLTEARAAVRRLMVNGVSMNDPRSVGYATAMRALIAILSDNYEAGLEIADLGINTSHAPFERAIASSARNIALVLLNKPSGLDEVGGYIAKCAENGWTLFLSGPDNLWGVGLAMNGRIDEGLRYIEQTISRREKEGYRASADWCRLFLCEVYLDILSGKGKPSLGLFLRNFRSLASVLTFGAKRIRVLIEQVRSNPQFDRDGHFIGRAEMILGLLYKAKKKKALAQTHLTEARRIVSAFGPSPMLARIDAALGELIGPPG
jgi:class 3 adenylate cyclase